MYLLAPFIMQYFKKNSQSRSRDMRMCHFRAQNNPFLLNKYFLVQTIIITFIHLLAIFTVQSLKKSLQQIKSYENVPFLGPKWFIYPPPPKTIFWKNYIILTYLLALFIVQNFKKILPADPDAQFLGPKSPISQNENFFRKSCLSTSQKSRSDINLSVKNL